MPNSKEENQPNRLTAKISLLPDNIHRVELDGMECDFNPTQLRYDLLNLFCNMLSSADDSFYCKDISSSVNTISYLLKVIEDGVKNNATSI